MSEGLREQIEALPDEVWKPYRSLRQEKEENSEEREWAEVVFVPGWARNHKKKGASFRYVAIRVRGRQRDLLEEDGARWRHFAVVTNKSWDGERLLQWHREKQGTVEHANGVVKNELAAGTLPCGRFGANAAWWRINVLGQNLLEILKVVGLPKELECARPNQLRFRLFNVAGRVLKRGRRLFLRISSRLPTAEVFAAARIAILRLSRLLVEHLLRQNRKSQRGVSDHGWTSPPTACERPSPELVRPCQHWHNPPPPADFFAPSSNGRI